MVLYNNFRKSRPRTKVEATGGSFVYFGMAHYACSRRIPGARGGKCDAVSLAGAQTNFHCLLFMEHGPSGVSFFAQYNDAIFCLISVIRYPATLKAQL